MCSILQSIEGRWTCLQLPRSVSFPLLKYKYYICYAPVLQQQEVFDACFNSLNESEVSSAISAVLQGGNTQFSLLKKSPFDSSEFDLCNSCRNSCFSGSLSHSPSEACSCVLPDHPYWKPRQMLMCFWSQSFVNPLLSHTCKFAFLFLFAGLGKK